MSKKVKALVLGLVVFLVFIGLQSCDSNSIYSEKKNIPNAWTNQDTIAFHYTIKDTVKQNDLLLTVVHDRQFPYENLYVHVNTSFPDGKTSNQLLSLQLTSANNVWMGECSGAQCTLTIPISSHIKFKKPGDYALKIVQDSRKDSLRGIASLQLDINRSEENK